MQSVKPIPVTVFTGFLGAGKTTIILNVVHSMASLSTTSSSAKYQIAWLKNEFGDNTIDSQLAKEANIDVTEILNGCLCCTMVGRLGDALLELATKHHPDRIVVETSGSAFPAPIAWEIRRLTEEGAPLHLDAILCVIDVINFKG
jgi:G3E family GTPase